MIDHLLKGEKAIAVVGLGYVGTPLAIEFGKVVGKVIGFDIRKQRIEELSTANDITGEITAEDLKNTRVDFTIDPKRLREASVIIIAVPTPIDKYKIPDLKPLESASRIVGENIQRGAVVVYESTVYPGVTEDFCMPIIEQYSGMKCGKDFKIGYSPERINPGDKDHNLTNIVKVVAGGDIETTELLAKIYELIVKAGIHKAPDIRTAEAAKVIENIQRDLNIALINELAIIFHKLGLDTRDVLDAASTKWNFLRFEPGLVGGHCIGVDPYYLTFKAQSLGYHPEVILSGRRINDSMGKYIAEQAIKHLIKSNKAVKGSKILILGFTFKDNVKDIRNTRVIDIYNELKEYGVEPHVHDPHASHKDVSAEYGIKLMQTSEYESPYDGIIIAVKHREYADYSMEYLKGLCNSNASIIDVKGIYRKNEALKAGLNYWRL
ncbi:MAG: nucleotide sugar dehydrogenase [Thermodesulfovibrionales bacterium]|nr:nucleotide sugar dehydrogenase [Thermodesulfovibrionales bacterium]